MTLRRSMYVSYFLLISLFSHSHARCLLSHLYYGVSAVVVIPRDPAAVDAIWAQRASPCDCHQYTPETPKQGVANLLVIASPALQNLSVYFHVSDINVLIPDIGVALESLPSQLHAYDFSNSSSSLDISFYNHFFSFEVLQQKWMRLAQQHPNRVTLFCYGRSWAGRPLYAMRVGAHPSHNFDILSYPSYHSSADNCDISSRLKFRNDQDEKIVFVNAAQHAREWLAPTSATYVSEYLASSKIWPLPDDVSVVIVPLANPDGYIVTDSVNRLWRKNVHPWSYDQQVFNPCQGVDLNRNWAANFNGSFSTSTDQCSNEYVGAHAFSEPETRSLRDLILRLARPRALFDVHTFGTLLLGPYQFSTAQVMHAALFDAIADIAKPEGFHYSRGSTRTVLYAASGFMSDWACLNGILGYTIELYPHVGFEHVLGFFPPTSQILPSAQVLMRSVSQLARYASVAPKNLSLISESYDSEIIKRFRNSPEIILGQVEDNGKEFILNKDSQPDVESDSRGSPFFKQDEPRPAWSSWNSNDKSVLGRFAPAIAVGFVILLIGIVATLWAIPSKLRASKRDETVQLTCWRSGGYPQWANHQQE